VDRVLTWLEVAWAGLAPGTGDLRDGRVQQTIPALRQPSDSPMLKSGDPGRAA